MLVDPVAHLPNAIAPDLLPDDPDQNILKSLAVRLLRGSDLNRARRVQTARKIAALADNTPLWFYVLAEASRASYGPWRRRRRPTRRDWTPGWARSAARSSRRCSSG